VFLKGSHYILAINVGTLESGQHSIRVSVATVGGPINTSPVWLVAGVATTTTSTTMTSTTTTSAPAISCNLDLNADNFVDLFEVSKFVGTLYEGVAVNPLTLWGPCQGGTSSTTITATASTTTTTTTTTTSPATYAPNPCPAGMYGSSCALSCPANCASSSCNTDGTCVGWDNSSDPLADQCAFITGHNLATNFGKFGPYCNNSCPYYCATQVRRFDFCCLSLTRFSSVFHLTCFRICSLAIRTAHV
jgi:hypothetical protein